MLLSIHAVAEAQPGPKWTELWERYWPYYREWFVAEGLLVRPGYLSVRRALRNHMPELEPIYEQLLELSGAGDVAARFLGLYGPPPYLTGCTQVTLAQSASLIRNYDYSPKLFEGTLLASNWLRPVIAMVDCLWGALDGVNDAGLIASLAFGGRSISGLGFGIPLVLRYLLETCDTTSDAIAALSRLPMHMPYNVSLIDREGHSATVLVAPDREAAVVPDAVCTNHQQQVEWPDYARLTRSVERKEYLEILLAAQNDDPDHEAVLTAFLEPPLYQTRLEQGFGTLYTARYRAEERALELHWPHRSPWHQSLADFTEGRQLINLTQARAAVGIGHLGGLVE